MIQLTNRCDAMVYGLLSVSVPGRRMLAAAWVDRALDRIDAEPQHYIPTKWARLYAMGEASDEERKIASTYACSLASWAEEGTRCTEYGHTHFDCTHCGDCVLEILLGAATCCLRYDSGMTAEWVEMIAQLAAGDWAEEMRKMVDIYRMIDNERR